MLTHREQMHISADPQVAAAVRDFSAKTGEPLARIYERAVVQLLQNDETRQASKTSGFQSTEGPNANLRTPK